MHESANLYGRAPHAGRAKPRSGLNKSNRSKETAGFQKSSSAAIIAEDRGAGGVRKPDEQPLQRGQSGGLGTGTAARRRGDPHAGSRAVPDARVPSPHAAAPPVCGCLLHYLLDVIIVGSFLQVTCQIHDVHTVGRNMEGYARELPIQLWDDLAHSLGSTRGCGDDVLGCPMAIISQLPGGAIHRFLGGSDGMDCGPESFHNARVVMDDLGWVANSWWCGSIADNLE
ncbi:hypothetical protein I79_018571 [Cricetulus griseus]|uniref:Uncharacterized protein n=1 Tax=Cricetulus griseus TaxID=10029 RepID=G3I530_CRIGR|nr:hypothetical protein I79_018571 [Cricetulus griseus]